MYMFYLTCYLKALHNVNIIMFSNLGFSITFLVFLAHQHFLSYQHTKSVRNFYRTNSIHTMKYCFKFKIQMFVFKKYSILKLPLLQ